MEFKPKLSPKSCAKILGTTWVLIRNKEVAMAEKKKWAKYYTRK